MKKDEGKLVYRANKDAKAGISLTNKSVIVAGSPRHFIAVDDKCVTIRGPISFVSEAERQAGIFVRPPALLGMIPSTIMSPIPKHMPMIIGLPLLSIVSDTAFFLSMIAAVS